MKLKWILTEVGNLRSHCGRYLIRASRVKDKKHPADLVNISHMGLTPFDQLPVTPCTSILHAKRVAVWQLKESR